MQLGGQRSSSNVEDRRGIGVGGGLGIGTIVIAVVAYFLGIDPSIVLDTASQMQQSSPQQQAPRDPNKPKDEGQVFVEKVLGSTEDVWKQLMPRYRDPGLVLFSGAVRSACGTGQSAMGPFYCPNDQKVYIDLAFYKDLRDRFRAPGDFAQAYVIAHEVGHHIQNQLGVMNKLQAMQGRVVPESFTHGTSAQRVKWFTRGLESGRPQDCDTFAAARL